MYISLGQIEQALNALERYHTFYGISFLVAKEANLPIGETIENNFSGRHTC